MKLLHTESSSGWGGQEIRVIDEAIGMVDRGHEATIAASLGSRIASEARRKGLHVAELPIGRKRLSGLFSIRRLMHELRPDVVVTHSSTDSWLTALACMLLHGSPPVVRTRHISAAIPANPLSRWLYRRGFAHVVTTGEALRSQVIREASVPSDRVTSIPTGIDLEHFRPGDRDAVRQRLRLPTAVFLIGIVATLRSWKGHRYLIEALSAIKDPAVQLLIVGDGPGRDAVRSQIKELGLIDRVHMAGEQHDVVPWMQSLDLFVLPSYANEGVPQAIMQAMACGLPVLSTDVGAIREILIEGKTGEFTVPRDSMALASRIESMRGRADDLAAMGRAARRVAESRFSRARMLDEMERVLGLVLAQSVQTAPAGRSSGAKSER